jgi:hypothetical protein
VFFKTVLNILLFFKKNFNYKINLELNADLVKNINYKFLYKISVKKLKIVKKYLKINLQKDFIIKSFSFFILLILIAHFTSKLRFYINF